MPFFTWLGHLARAFPRSGRTQERLTPRTLGRDAQATFVVAFFSFALIAAAPVTTTQQVHFTTLDVRIDPQSTALAAYQIELTAPSNVKLVGIEGGEHPAFKDPPYYDPAALRGNRVILAAFNAGKQLPTTAFRAARLHVQIEGEQKIEWQIKVIVASTPDGAKIARASATVSEGVEQ